MKEIITTTITISVFVTSMMILLEFVNILSSGKWLKSLQRRSWLQVPLAALFGMIPGCLGTYAVISMYTHRLIGFGALTALLISTSGDEAFFMLSASPVMAIKVFVILLVSAIATGYIVDAFQRKKYKKQCHFEIHEDADSENKLFRNLSLSNIFKSMTMVKAILLLSLATFIICVLTGIISHEHFTGFLPESEVHTHDGEICTHDHHGHHHHDHGFGWFGITLLVISSLNLIILFLADSHFISDHIWKHVIKKHFLKVFMWTLLAMSLIVAVNNYWDPHYISEILHSKYYFILLAVAIIVGIIPESGPHLIFISLFLSGNLPFGILLANSAVQDGHGALPLFAESKRDFIKTKLINMGVGLILGTIFYFLV